MTENMLKVGIHNGGSIKLWSDYFTNAQGYGMDIMYIVIVYGDIKNKEKIKKTDIYKCAWVWHGYYVY